MNIFGETIRLFKNLALVPLYIVSVCLPKNRNLWVFGAWMGARYSDNAAVLFEFVEQQQTAVDAKWISKDRALVAELIERGVKAYYYCSFRGIFYQLRAGVAIFTHSASSDLFGPCISSSTLKVNVWHGTPIKKIGADDTISKKSILDIILTRFFRLKLQRNDLFIAGSAPAANIYHTAFSLDKNSIVITGEPRSDIVLEGSKKKEHTPLSQLKVLYAPTFAGEVGSTFDFFGDFSESLSALDEKLSELNTVLRLRLHPVNKYSTDTLSAVERCNSIELEKTPELSSVVYEYDCLVTDFSSLIFDFAILDKPVYFLPLDLENYLSSDRQLYVDYDEFTEGYLCSGWDHLLSQLSVITASIRVGTAGSPEAVKKYSMAFRDGKNRERVVSAILNKLH